MQEPHHPEQPVAGAQGTERVETTLAAIEAEQISRRHLRRALQIAKVHGIEAKSEFDAVRLLRDAGIDPFSLASMVPIVSSVGDPIAALHDSKARSRQEHRRKRARLPSDAMVSPRRARKLAFDTSEQHAEVNQAAEILRMQQDIARRRRRRLRHIALNMFAFVMLPTFLSGCYFYMIATPMYSVQSEFFIQQAGQASSGKLFGGLLSGNSPDSFAVEGYLKSVDAMVRLDADSDFRAHFENEEIDPFQRLSPDATLETAYKVYRKFIDVSFDPKDEMIRMNVMAADPEIAANWSRQLIRYAEDQVDQLSQRLKADQMRDAQRSYEAAEEAVSASQRRLAELQQKYGAISGRIEVALVVSQLSRLEDQILQDRLSLAQMEGNLDPNQSRMELAKRRIAAIEAQIATLRARMTGDSVSETSIAKIQADLLQAEADLKSRQMLASKALVAVEAARLEAHRQSRYLLLSVSPIPPDEPNYPRTFTATLLTMLIFLGFYLTGSLVVQSLREQFST